MKRFLVFVLVGLLLAAGRLTQATPSIPPAPTAWVTDTAGFLTEPTRQTLDARLEAYEQTSGHQVLVWIGKTTGETPLEDWTAQAFQAWRVGRKGLDDGLILFVFSADHTARIEVGYGLEGQVTDVAASRILRAAVLPKIQANDHDGAVTAGVDRLIAALGGKETAPTGASSAQPLSGFQIFLLVLAVIAFLLLAIRYPALAWFLLSVITSGGSGGGGGFSGKGGRSGGGGASGSW